MELNFKSFGQGDPVIILHGLFGMLDNWQTIAKKLADNYTVFLVDQRNHGRSPHDDQFDYPTMAADLMAFMESQWIHQSHVIGHSMGGKTAMEFALTYPDSIDHLVVVDIAPKSYEGGHQAIFEALFSLNLKEIENRKEAEQALEAKISDFGVRQFLLKNLSRNKAGYYEWKMNLPAIHKNYQNILAATQATGTMEAPTLFIKGGQSNYIEDTDEDLIHSFFPTAKIKTIEKAGHWVHAEAPKELLGEVEAFFSTS